MTLNQNLTAKEQLIARMEAIIADPEHPLMAAAIGVVKEGNILFAEAVGQKQLGGAPATGDTNAHRPGHLAAY